MIGGPGMRCVARRLVAAKPICSLSWTIIPGWSAAIGSASARTPSGWASLWNRRWPLVKFRPASTPGSAFVDAWLSRACAKLGIRLVHSTPHRPQDKPRVERMVQYVRRNFWDGETFTSLEQAQQAVMTWCLRTAGTRIHGTTCARPLEVFTTDEQPRLLPVPGPMTCRCSKRSRYTAISTPRSPKPCIRCPSAGSGTRWTYAPTVSW